MVSVLSFSQVLNSEGYGYEHKTSVELEALKPDAVEGDMYYNSDLHIHVKLDENGDFVPFVGSTSSVMFADILGNPSDNTALGSALDSKIGVGVTNVGSSNFIIRSSGTLLFDGDTYFNYMGLYPNGEVQLFGGDTSASGVGVVIDNTSISSNVTNTQIDNKGDSSLITKGYADANYGGGSGTYLPLSGGTMTGDINMGYNDILSDGVATFRNAFVYDDLTVGAISIGDGTTPEDSILYFVTGSEENQLYVDDSDGNKLKYYNNETGLTTELGGGGTDDQTAPEVPYTDTYSIGETDVQGAIDYAISNGGGGSGDPDQTLSVQTDSDVLELTKQGTNDEVDLSFLRTQVTDQATFDAMTASQKRGGFFISRTID